MNVYSFNKLIDVIHKTRPQETEKDGRITRFAFLCWADNTAEAIAEGLNSVTIEEIDYLMESTWYGLKTMEEWEEDDDFVQNYTTPFGQRILSRELVGIALSIRPAVSTKEKTF